MHILGARTPSFGSIDALFAYIFRDDATGDEDILAAGVSGRLWAPLVWRDKASAISAMPVALKIMESSPPGSCRLVCFSGRTDIRDVA